MQIGQLITDGTAIFIIRDTRDGTPVGAVVGRINVPPSYVKLNGATVLRNSYPTLVKYADDNEMWTDDLVNDLGKFGRGDGATTMVLPDYRGVFKRFSDDGKGYDPERKVGTYQIDEFKSHTHYVSTSGYDTVGGGRDGLAAHYQSGATGAVGGTETRPKNIAEIAVMKY